MDWSRAGIALLLYIGAQSFLPPPFPAIVLVLLLAALLSRHMLVVKRWLAGRLQKRLPTERVAKAATIAGLRRYREYMIDVVLARKKRLFFMLSPDQQQMALPTYQRLKQLEELADRNGRLLDDIASFAAKSWGIEDKEVNSVTPDSGYSGVELLSLLVRDWSPQRSKAQIELFKPFWRTLPTTGRLLVPGAGLGRLAVDAAERGLQVDALEMSALMLAGSEFAASGARKSEIYPYLYDFSHWRHASDQLEATPVEFSSEKVNWQYGNFLSYDSVEKYDAVATLFFIDTAQNVFAYIDRIKYLLKPGGVWTNFGPLKWGTAPYVEPSVDELLKYIELMGFEISPLFEGSDRYDGSSRSMLRSSYGLVGWSAKLKSQ